jgi:hypothetical protein
MAAVLHFRARTRLGQIKDEAWLSSKLARNLLNIFALYIKLIVFKYGIYDHYLILRVI